VTTRSSVSDAPSAAGWLYTPPAFGRTGRSLSENNFAKERRDWIAILLREVLQNALDARRPGPLHGEPVLVSVRESTLSDAGAAYFERLVPDGHLARLHASMPQLAEGSPELRRFLVVEDFGTTGLTGETASPDVDGDGQNWNAFWFREGEGGKEQGSGNGGAGQGKITYFSTSAIRTIFVYTVRCDDNRSLLFGASSFLRDYDFGGQKCLRDSYWGIRVRRGDATISTPSEEAREIERFRREFAVSRQPGQTGVSLVIPAPREFDLEVAVQVVIAEFFAPILRGDLVVRVGDTSMDSTSIASIADRMLSDERARQLHTCMTSGYRDFLGHALERSRNNEIETIAAVDVAAKLTEASFDAASLAALREALDRGEQIAVRVPLVVKPKSGSPANCHFDVHLMCPEDLAEVEQAILRKDLLIGEEPIGGGALRQRARGLTLINDPVLSKLLLCAEEATHLRWNARLPRLKERYRSGSDVVALVRNAMARLLDVLTGGDQKRDFRLLAKYFAAPGTAAHNKIKGKRSPKGKGQSEHGEIPPPKPKKLLLEPLADGCKVLASRSNPPTDADLPLRGVLEFAYEGLDKDAFAEYDPLDFDLSEASFSIRPLHCIVTSRGLNRLEFAAASSDFALLVNGFDKNLRLRVRLNYTEAKDAQALDA
jgi:hypothetical protein